MARIPMGDFGGVIAQPGPRASVDPAAYGAGVGRAMEQAGSIGMRAAGQEMAQQEADAEQQRRIAAAEAKQAERERLAEAKQAQRQAEADARAAAREAARVKAVTAQATITNGLNDLHDEISAGLADGSIDKTKALEHFQTRAATLQSQGLEGVDPEHRPLVEATLLDNLGRARRSVSQLVTARDKQDIKAGGLAYFEEMQRFAARGPKEADQAIANVRTFWTATGPMAGEDAAAASSRVQQFAERVRFTQATALVNADPAAALKALKNPEYLPELDPGQRTNLLATADARVTQAANRAEIAAQARERKMRTEWESINTVFSAGKTLDPASLENARRTFKGTPYAAALEQMTAESPARTAFASQPVAAQTQALMAMQERMNKGGASPADIEAYKKAEAVHKATLADIKADPFQAAAERGVIQGLAPLTLDIQTLPAQLQRRGAEAAQVSTWVGREVSPFRPAEVEKIGAVLSAMPPKDKAGALEGLARVMSPGQRQAFAEQLDPKDKSLALAMAYVGRQTTSNRPVAELVLRGQQARIDGTSTKGQKQPEVLANKWGATAAEALSDVFADQRTADQVRESAVLIMHGIAAEQGGELSKADMERAVRLAVGGTIVEHNGARIPLPAGVDESALRKRLGSVTAAEIGGGDVIAGGVKMPAEQFVKAIPGAQLMPYRSGQFAVVVGGRPVIGANGKPVVIGVSP